MNVSEIYTSVQGEGPNAGKPTTFVRFGGCNLRCTGWGEGVLPDGTIVPGCDTVFAVYPEWHTYWEALGTDEILQRIPESPKHVCITGGEPLVQRAGELSEFAWRLLDDGYSIDLFTNGSRSIRNHLSWASHIRTTVIMDWKLVGSGEGGKFDPDNLNHLFQKDCIKFVVKELLDFEETLIILNSHEIRAKILFAPVWGKLDPGDLAMWVASRYPQGQLSIQQHKYIWDPNERKR